ncbi:MAG TPA: gamma-glutamyltransferase [Spongiibacteraceae bacterium]|jgi:gamma-glutamyltranspeptidase/glutathione hydrolase
MIRSLIASLCLCVCLYGDFVSAADNTLVPEAASAIDSRFAASQNATAVQFMAVTANAHATAAAVEMLHRGGSAIDAMIAAQLVLGLVEPQASGIGGGAFMLYWDQQAQQLHYFDGRETAPARVDENYFLQDNGEPLAFLDAVIGGHAVGAPGIVKLLAMSHQRFGKLPWADLFQPAIRLAEHGFIISPRLFTLLNETPRLQESPSLRAYFFLADGSPKPAGTLLKNPAYAKTLKLIARDGEQAFYRGALAQDIVKAVQTNPNRKGALALDDLAAYKAIERTPLCMNYLEYKVCGAAPPSSGATSVFAILGILQHFPIAQRQPNSAAFAHLFAEASRLAFADRDTYVADPDFVAVPTEGLIAPAYLAERAQLINPHQAAATVQAGQPAWPKAAAHQPYITSPSPERISTSHLSLVDRFGNALSMTTSVESAFGSRVLVDGFLLNNQLTDFSFVPRDTAGTRVANRIEPGKRPRSSMSPVIVFRDGKPVLLLGSPGGARIIDYVAKTLAYSLDNQISIAEAIASPHIVAMNRGVELEQGSSNEQLKPALEALGHVVKLMPQSSGLNGISIDGKKLTGSSDPRREGAVGGE